MWRFSCWKLERYLFLWYSEISQSCTLTWVYFCPLYWALGGSFNLGSLIHLRNVLGIFWLRLSPFYFFFLSFPPLKLLFEHWASWTSFFFFFNSLLLCSILGKEGADFLNSIFQPFYWVLNFYFSPRFFVLFLFIVPDFHIFSCVSEDINDSKWHRDLQRQGHSAYLENKIPAAGSGWARGR